MVWKRCWYCACACWPHPVRQGSSHLSGCLSCSPTIVHAAISVALLPLQPWSFVHTSVLRCSPTPWHCLLRREANTPHTHTRLSRREIRQILRHCTAVPVVQKFVAVIREKERVDKRSIPKYTLSKSRLLHSLCLEGCSFPNLFHTQLSRDPLSIFLLTLLIDRSCCCCGFCGSAAAWIATCGVRATSK